MNTDTQILGGNSIPSNEANSNDLKIANMISILTTPELRGLFTEEEIIAIQTAVKFHTVRSAIQYNSMNQLGPTSLAENTEQPRITSLL